MANQTTNVCIHTDNKAYTTHHIPVQQLGRQVTHGTKNHPDALGKSIWDNSEPIYWQFDGHFNHIDDDTAIKIFKMAFLMPSVETPLKIRQRRRKTADSQIKIDVRTKKEDKILTSDSTLAYAYGPGRGLGGDSVFNQDVLWLLRKEPLTALEAKEKGYIDDFSNPNSTIRFYDPISTAIHEVGGHSLGMNHIEGQQNREEIMFPLYNGNRKFGPADKEYLHRLYGKSSVNHRIKEMLYNRVSNFF